MSKQNSIREFGFLRLDGRKRDPLFRQLYEQIRNAILQGRIKSNRRIPSSRDLMNQLGVSRTTVITAIDLLIAEGYLQTLRGKGTYVSSEIPDEQFLPNGVTPVDLKRCTKQSNHLSAFGKLLSELDPTKFHTGTPIAFCPGEPALDEFPIEVWSKIVRKIWKSISPMKLSYGEAAGYFPLRSQLAEYLSVHRGVNCEVNQVMIVNGTQHAIDLVARLALDSGDQVLFEDPGYVIARDAFEKHGAEVVSMPVDDAGAMVAEATNKSPKARLAYVTPSHQFPLGTTLPIERRLELIDWAQENDALILEDDYDSEYRYSQRPFPCLQGLDRGSRTIYVGSFSKVVYPALGLGYAIVPPQMVTAFENALRLTSRSASQVDQVVLSEFIREGHFIRHLRRMRKIHAERRAVFVAELEKHLSHQLSVIGGAAGLHCTTLLKTKKPDVECVARLHDHGIIARPLSSYYGTQTRKPKRKNGLVFGFACTPILQIRRQIKRVSALLS